MQMTSYNSKILFRWTGEEITARARQLAHSARKFHVWQVWDTWNQWNTLHCATISIGTPSQVNQVPSVSNVQVDMHDSILVYMKLAFNRGIPRTGTSLMACLAMYPSWNTSVCPRSTAAKASRCASCMVISWKGDHEVCGVAEVSVWKRGCPVWHSGDVT
jgi:hypothetical protein